MASESKDSRSSSAGDRVTVVLIIRQLARAAVRLVILPLQWLAARLRIESLSRKRLAVWATLLFVAATALAIKQYVAPYAWHQPHALLRWTWWVHPLERNLDAGLPKIDGNINAVLATSDGACLWIAGDAGLLAFSGDQGKNWTQLPFDRVSGDFRAAVDARACGQSGGVSSSVSGLSLVQKVYAASAPGPGAQQVPPKQNSQPQTQTALPKNKNGSNNSPQQNSNPQSFASSAAPSLRVFPAKVDFGSAIASRKYPPARASIHIRNLSPEPISLGNMALSPIAFQVDQGQKESCAEQTIPPGGECILPLTFVPTKPGKFQGQVVFASSNQSKPWIVLLFGIGEDPPESAAAPTDASTGDNAPRSTGRSNPPGTGATAPVSGTQNPLSKPSASQTSLSASGSSGNSTLKAKLPDLWGFDNSQTGLGYIVTGDGDFYGPENLGLIWRRVGPPYFNLLRTISIADKELEFVENGAFGGYRLKTVGTRVFPPTSGKRITSASIAGPERHGWAINYVAASSPDNRTPNNLVKTQILYTANDGANWSALNTFAGEVLKSVNFRGDGRTGWVAGDNGVLLSTVNAGATWQPLTFAAGRLLRQGRWTAPKGSEQYIRFVAPWYLLTLLICGVLVTPILFPVDVSESPDDISAEIGRETKVPRVAGTSEADASAIGNQAIADKPLEPGDPDALGLSTIAAGLAFFLRNAKTKPPLAIAINGRWGSGKSSLMNLLKSNLEAWGAHPVWFNAWHHQKEDQMLAALLQAVKTQAVPPLWQTSGVTFRAKLAWRRLQRSWFNLVLVAGGIFLVYKAGTFVATTFQVSFLSLVKTVFSGSGSTEAVNKLKDKPIFTILTAAGAIYKIISSGFTAFGTKPASLLASVSGGTNIKDLDAQTSFRQRFASEFDDVTQSLGKNQRMLILIDDLDRCRPEKVREVLEGVNFLASSGDCFIVLGMARDIVEHCVGLSFARVVDTMSWEAMGLTPPDIARVLEGARRAEESKEKLQAPVEAAAGGTASNMESYAKRRAFAHLYLDKLIQIEVSVPEPTPSQRRLLFRSEDEIKKGRNPNERRVQAVVERSRRIYAGAQPVVAAALSALVLFGVWTLVRPTVRSFLMDFGSNGQNTGDTDQGKAPENANGASAGTTSSPATSSDSAAPAGVPTPSSGATSSPSSGSPATPTTKPAALANEGVSPYGPQPSQFPTPSIVEYSAGIFTTGWPFYLLLLGTVSLIATSLRRLPQRIVRDEAPFTNALSVWHPLVMTGGAKNTPRTARRFQNRVRYLAMRQRALLRGKAMSLGERWLRDRLNSPVPRIDRPVHLAESQEIDSKLVDEAHEVREIVESGQSGKCGSWQVKISADRIELTASGTPKMPEEQFKALVLGNVYIPEPVLVALAAIEEYAPEWIVDEDLFQSKVVHPTPGSAKEEKMNMLSKTLEEHGRYWNNWHNLSQYRRAYLALCSEMTRGGNARTAM
jgi:hypothetical protein